jgi:hypothetical protein
MKGLIGAAAGWIVFHSVDQVLLGADSWWPAHHV